ncbi:YdeI family protein [Lewinella sp. 4G2]|uniref:YdeI/OmpD-associated family protein n=1 Tax=Lewinella sp. 4G2 TaxID=1803372 RepID=UPI0007E09CCB|nr:YdeI/OmpD-associated family protein [Lewinella sp. 4G2]OAV45164.1 hypothetical protein A3850_011975 [Lewinella sp. 4G2]
MPTPPNRIEITSPTQLREWLAANYAQEASVWLVTYKKSTPSKYFSNSEMLDELLAYGWMDGRRMKLDDERTMQLISPRRVEHWSKTYKDRVAKLEKEGRMAEPGRAAVARGKASGLWDFLNDVDALIQPDDLKAALAQNAVAEEFFNALSPARMRFALRWIKLAKGADTRARRIAKVVELSGQGERVAGS